MFGQTLSKLRKQNDVSQEELARKLGVTWQTISQWEDDEASPSIEQIVALSDFFGVSTDVLLRAGFQTKTNTSTQHKSAPKQPRRNLLIAFSAMFILAVVAAAVFIGIKFLPRNAAGLSAEEISDITAPSMVEIHALSLHSQISGMGFFIDDQGTVITNYHTIKDCMDADIILQDGTEHSVMSVLGYDENLDIAILSTSCMHSMPVSCREGAVSSGEKLYTLDSSSGLSGIFSEGTVSSAERKIKGSVFIQISSPVTDNNTGSPLVDNDGLVAGITTSIYGDGKNTNLAIPITSAMNIKKDSGIGSLKRNFLAKYSDVIDPFAMLTVETALDDYIENPNAKTRASLKTALEN